MELSTLSKYAIIWHILIYFAMELKFFNFITILFSYNIFEVFTAILQFIYLKACIFEN